MQTNKDHPNELDGEDDDFFFINDSDREFVDISHEQWREYVFPKNITVICRPKLLHISSSGHYVVNSEGVVYFMPCVTDEPGSRPVWHTLRWKPFPGKPHFTF